MKRRLSALCLVGVAASGAAAPAVRIEPGLVIVSAVRDAVRGVDYEAIVTVLDVSADGLRSSSQWAVPDPSRENEIRHLEATSFARAQDRQTSHRILLWHLQGDPETLPGTTGPTPSVEVFRELRETGQTQVVIGAVSNAGPGAVLGGMLAGRKYFRGTLRRVGTEPVRVLVNGVATMLPAVHARGQVSVGTDRAEVEFWWLDDPQAPLGLRVRFQGSDVHTVRIDSPRAKAVKRAPGPRDPAAPEDASPLRGLAGKSCRAEVSGIYFLTNSAELLRASQPSIENIAGMLRAHPDWIVTIEGHTDNVGSDAHNLMLSQHRAESLREELVRRHGIGPQRLKTAGFGAKRPIDTNDTFDGRAHNRRVEVARSC